MQLRICLMRRIQLVAQGSSRKITAQVDGGKHTGARYTGRAIVTGSWSKKIMQPGRLNVR